MLMYIGPPGALRDSLTDYTCPISHLLPLATSHVSVAFDIDGLRILRFASILLTALSDGLS